jgi:hypothetical protein
MNLDETTWWFIASAVGMGIALARFVQALSQAIYTVIRKRR